MGCFWDQWMLGNGYVNGFYFVRMLFEPLLFILLIAAGVAVFLKWRKGGFTYFSSKNQALEIAKLRYARGEMTTDEYQEMIKRIG